MQEKRCVCCNKSKDLSCFYTKGNGYLRVDSKCKKCVLQSKKKHYKKLKRARLGVIEVTDDNGTIPEEAVYLFANNLRCL